MPARSAPSPGSGCAARASRPRGCVSPRRRRWRPRRPQLAFRSIRALGAHAHERTVLGELDAELDGPTAHLAILDVAALAAGDIDQRVEPLAAIRAAIG